MPIDFKLISDPSILAIEAFLLDSVRYVSSRGDNSYDGLSAGNAKLTISAAVASLPLIQGTPAGLVYLLPGGYSISSQVTGGRYLSVLGAGASLVTVSTSVNGISFLLNDSPFSALQCGAFGGMTIIPSTPTTFGNGVWVRDCVGLKLFDLDIHGFNQPNNSGLVFENVNGWNEQHLFDRVRIYDNAKDIRFYTTTTTGPNQSFEFNHFNDLRLGVNANQIGMSVEGTSYLNKSSVIGALNMSDNGIGINVQDTAQFVGTSFSPFAMEQTSGVGGISVKCEAGSVFGYSGLLDAGGMPFSGAGAFVYHEGTTPGIVVIGVPGNAALTIDGTLGTIFQVGPMAGNITGTTFENLLIGRIYTLVFIQDSAGNRSITLPANIKWAGGSFPTWSTTGDYRDIVQFYFDGVSLFEISRSIGVH